MELPEQLGRYRILKRLGQGGMGSVFLAEDTQLGRQVALKVPRFSPKDNPTALARLWREARAAASFYHPNVCPIHDAVWLDGVFFLVFQYIEGRLLSDFVDPKRPPDQRWVAAKIRTLALALGEAHDRGVIHRDLKPRNILVDGRGRLVVVDFGLARLAERDDSKPLTRTGELIGTPAYLAPERLQGAPDANGPGCDIFSLGVIMYELLTGRCPFVGSVEAVLGQILFSDPKPPSEYRPDLDPQLQNICLKAMARRVGDRFPSMSALAAALEDYLGPRDRSTRFPTGTEVPGLDGEEGGAAHGSHRESAAAESSSIARHRGLWRRRGPARRPGTDRGFAGPVRSRLAMVLAGATLLGLLGGVAVVRSSPGRTEEVRQASKDPAKEPSPLSNFPRDRLRNDSQHQGPTTGDPIRPGTVAPCDGGLDSHTESSPSTEQRKTPSEPASHGSSGEAGTRGGNPSPSSTPVQSVVSDGSTRPDLRDSDLPPKPSPLETAGGSGHAGSEPGPILSLTTPIVCEKIEGYGRYLPLAAPAVYRDQKLLIYYEPVGYNIGREGDKYHIHLSQDTRIRRHGKTAVLCHGKDIVNYDVTTPGPPHPVYIQYWTAVDWLKPGSYELDIILHDRIGTERVASQTLFFQVLPSPAGLSASGSQLHPCRNSQ
jgi:serine/threonine protein kinase